MKFEAIPMKVTSHNRDSAIDNMLKSSAIQNRMNKMLLSGGQKISVPCPSSIGSLDGSNPACEASISANKALLEAKVGAIYDGGYSKIKKTRKRKKGVKTAKKKKRNNTAKRKKRKLQ